MGIMKVKVATATSAANIAAAAILKAVDWSCFAVWIGVLAITYHNVIFALNLTCRY
jgi:hypothetical protein